MSCSNCFQDNKEAFKRATCVFRIRRSLVIFLLNVVLNIKELWEIFVFAKKLD